MNDELFERMNAIDPHPASAPVEPGDGLVARTLRESIMNSPIDTSSATVASPSMPTRRLSGRSRLGLALGGLGLVVVAVAAGLTRGGSSEPTSLAATLPASDPMAMCLTIAEYQPDPGASAFAGHVVEVNDGTVTVDVDEWDRNGDTDQVVLTVSDTGMIETGLDGAAFVDGAELLVTIVDGTVQTCGISGTASPELREFYATWYG